MQVVFEIIGMGAKKYGGFERYILEEARQLKERGYKLVVVLIPSRWRTDTLKTCCTSAPLTM